MLHPVLTALAVTATANHWWLDGVVAGMVLMVAIASQRAATRVARRWRGTVLPDVPAIRVRPLAADAIPVEAEEPVRTLASRPAR